MYLSMLYLVSVNNWTVLIEVLILKVDELMIYLCVNKFNICV